MNMKTFCIIPAFNEEEKILKVIRGVKNLVDVIVIIDDGSSDNTYQKSKQEGVVVLQHILNRGQGAALETGNKYALKEGAGAVVHFDGDGQFLNKEINDILEPILKNECDIVFGSRFLSKKTEMPFVKKNIIFPLARLVNRIFGVHTSDPQSGFRALNKKALNKIRITNDGSAHCSEILIKAYKYNLKIKEVPIEVIYNEYGQGFFGGKGRGKGGIRILKDLLIQKLIS